MGLFRRRKKNKDVDDYSVSFENLNASDDSFLVSAISSSPNSDYFETTNEVAERTRGYGASSGLAYYNKYSATNQKLASSDVVDIGAIKKPAPVVKPPEPPKPEPKKEESVIDESDILLKPVDMDDNGEDDQDFDSFFEDFMKKSKVNSETEKEEKKVETPIKPIVQEKPKPKKTSAPRKKKRAIDIDIISGTGGGDII